MSFNIHTYTFYCWSIEQAKQVASSRVGNPVCPSADAISPCSCKGNYLGDGVQLDCQSKELTDTQLSNILDAFLPCGISPLVSLSANINNLTRVPSQILKMNALAVVDFSNNKITSIPSGAFSSPSAQWVYIALRYNQIPSIPSDAFNYPSATTLYIGLQANLIQSIPSGIFKYPSATTVSIVLNSNQITAIPSDMFYYPSASGINIDN